MWCHHHLRQIFEGIILERLGVPRVDARAGYVPGQQSLQQRIFLDDPTARGVKPESRPFSSAQFPPRRSCRSSRGFLGTCTVMMSDSVINVSRSTFSHTILDRRSHRKYTDRMQ